MDPFRPTTGRPPFRSIACLIVSLLTLSLSAALEQSPEALLECEPLAISYSGYRAE